MFAAFVSIVSALAFDSIVVAVAALFAVFVLFAETQLKAEIKTVTGRIDLIIFLFINASQKSLFAFGNYLNSV
jgi:hypothetical protein